MGVSESVRVQWEEMAAWIIRRDGRATGTIPVIPVARSLDSCDETAVNVARRLQSSGRVPAGWRLDWTGREAYGREWREAGGGRGAQRRRAARARDRELAEPVAAPMPAYEPTPKQILDGTKATREAHLDARAEPPRPGQATEWSPDLLPAEACRLMLSEWRSGINPLVRVTAADDDGEAIRVRCGHHRHQRRTA